MPSNLWSICGMCAGLTVLQPCMAATALPSGTPPAGIPTGPDIVAEARPLAAELTKARYSQSRCMVPAVLADDGRTVIKSTAAGSADGAFAAGDQVIAVDADSLDENNKTAFIAELERRAADAELAITVARDGASRTLHVQCTDARPYYSALRAGADAASVGDAASCDDRIAAAARLHGLSSVWMRLAMSCRIKAGRLSGGAMWQADFELYSQRIAEARGSEQQLELIRHAIVGAARDLAASGHAPLADALHRQYAAALGMHPAAPDQP